MNARRQKALSKIQSNFQALRNLGDSSIDISTAKTQELEVFADALERSVMCAKNVLESMKKEGEDGTTGN